MEFNLQVAWVDAKAPPHQRLIPTGVRPATRRQAEAWTPYVGDPVPTLARFFLLAPPRTP